MNFKSKRYLVCAFVVVAFCFSSKTVAEDLSNTDTDQIIKACWTISEDLRSGSTADMRNGTARTIGCLEKRIIEQAEALFTPEMLDALELQKKLDQFQFAYQKIYWAIYNDHRGCRLPSLSCGTIYHLSHLSAHARVLEKMLRDMTNQRIKYGISTKTER